MNEDDFAHCECMHCSGPSGPCAVCELEAELRWCDAERRLALRALAEMADDPWHCHCGRPRVAKDGFHDLCRMHVTPGARVIRDLELLAAADEEIER